MKTVITIIIMVYFVNHSFSQETKIDSLTNIEKRTDIDTVKFDAQIKLSNIFLSVNPDSALFWINKAKKTAKKIGKKSEIKCYKNLGIANIYKGNIDKAIIQWQRGFDLALELNDLKMQADYKSNIAIAYTQTGNTEKALSLYNEVITISKKINYEKRIIATYQNRGTLYNNLGLYKEALEQYYNLAKQTTDLTLLPDTYNNLATIYAKSYDYENAEKYFNLALKSYKIQENIQGEIRVYSNLISFFNDNNKFKEAITTGVKVLVLLKRNPYPVLRASIESSIATAYTNIGKYNKAISYYETSLRKKKQFGRKFSCTYTYIGLAEVYNNIKDFNKALAYNDSAMSIIQELNLVDLKSHAYEKYSKIYYSKLDYKNALKYHKLFKIANDTIFNQDKINILAGLNIRYETEKKEQKITLQQKENEIQEAELKQQKTLIWLIVFVFALIFILIVVYIIIRSQKQKQKTLKLQVEAQDYTKKEISSELHTGIGSELTAIILQLENKQGNTKETESIKKIYRHIRTASHILSLPDFIVSTIEDEINNLVTNFKTENLEIEAGIFSKTGWKNISPIIQQTIYRIVQELFTNTMKHAQASQIEIQLVRHSNFINLSYEDNGKGYNPQEIIISKGYQDEIIARTKIIKGTYTDDSKINDGTILTFKFPV